MKKKAAAARPSLRAMRAFEAVVRLESLTRAARELNVSVSAVAFQIRNLEEAAGTVLVQREGRGLGISPEAGALAADLKQGFDRIDQAWARLCARGRAGEVVTVGLLPSFAALWLLPRLDRLRARRPDLDLRIATSTRLVDWAEGGVDCAIRCGPGGWERVDAEILFPQLLSPVCHWTYVERHGRPERPADLSAHALIGDRLRPEEWPEWFGEAGGDGLLPAIAQEVEGRELVVDAVSAGLGIGILDISVMGERLRKGDLVQLFPASRRTGWNHCILTPAGREIGPACRAFRDWILAEAQA